MQYALHHTHSPAVCLPTGGASALRQRSAAHTLHADHRHLLACQPFCLRCPAPAEEGGRQNIAFVAHFLLGHLDRCIDLLLSCGRLPEAAFFARTYAPSRMTEVRRQGGMLLLLLLLLHHHLPPSVAQAQAPTDRGAMRVAERSTCSHPALTQPPPLGPCLVRLPRLPSRLQVVQQWQADLAKINPKAAESLANPQEYPNLFPGIQDALQAEAYLRAKAATPVPATRCVWVRAAKPGCLFRGWAMPPCRWPACLHAHSLTACVLHLILLLLCHCCCHVQVPGAGG